MDISNSTLETASCTICRSPAVRAFSTPDGRIHRCNACHHCFTDPRSIAATEAYRDDYYDEAHKNWNAHPDIGLFDRVLAIIKRRGHPSGSLLDVGCSRMAFLHHAQRTGCPLALHGIDLGPHLPPDPAIRYTQSGIFEFAPEQRFDVITSFMVIEHVPDPIRFATRLASLCKPGGTVIINTINEGSILYRTARGLARVGLPGPANRLYSQHHVQHFTKPSLATALERGGLTVRAVMNDNIPMSQVDHSPMNLAWLLTTKVGIAGCFMLGRLTGMTFAQTVDATPSR